MRGQEISEVITAVTTEIMAFWNTSGMTPCSLIEYQLRRNPLPLTYTQKRQQFIPKRWQHSTRLYGFTSHKTVTLLILDIIIKVCLSEVICGMHLTLESYVKYDKKNKYRRLACAENK
jgi:hypothetical protein